MMRLFDLILQFLILSEVSEVYYERKINLNFEIRFSN